MDSQLVARQITGIYRVKHPNLLPMYQKAKSMLRHFGRFSIRHTLRAGLYMVITTACFVAGDTCIKLIGTTLPLGQENKIVNNDRRLIAFLMVK